MLFCTCHSELGKMCGICVFLVSDEAISRQDKEEHVHHEIQRNVQASRLHRRGPDFQHVLEIPLGSTIIGVFYGCILHLRGELTVQPLQDIQGNILLWNGEIFGGLEVSVGLNDGAVLLAELSTCNTERELLKLLSLIQGPWAFVYWKASERQLWFGRDIFGRRSLLYHIDTDGSFGLASLAVKPWTPWHEVPAIGLYCAILDTNDLAQPIMGNVKLYPWAQPCGILHHSGPCSSGIFNKTLMSQGPPLGSIPVQISEIMIHPGISPFNRNVSDTDDIPLVEGTGIRNIDGLANDHQRIQADLLTKVLDEAVKVRTMCQSEKCSWCIGEWLRDSKKKISNFSQMTASELTILDDGVGACSEQAVVEGSPEQAGIGTKIDQMKISHCCTIPQSDQETVHRVGCGHARIAILFSGGIDSLMIAALSNRSVPEGEPIDLLNVAFELQQTIPCGKKCKQGVPEVSTSSYEVPDRITGREGLQQLQYLYPNRQWNLVQIDVTVEELQRMRNEHVKDLLYPLTTVLDDSIGCAIWFAARGQGVIIDQSRRSILYTSPARVVLVGMGADEQLMGYSRHRFQFKTSGWSGLVGDIQMEIERISSRNLGRDDRVISDSSRESRFPFLDENVVSFLNSLPLQDKANLHLPRGVGEKFLLRLAAERLGLTRGALAPKRAIQFGSRIAKVENRKEKGSDSCNRLLNEKHTMD